MEPFLHHNFVYEQAPVMPHQPKPTSMFKFDFLKRTVDNRSAFTSRTTEVGQMVAQGNIVVVESKATAVLAVDVPKMAKKGDKMEVFATTWFEFDQSTGTIVKMKGYECVGGQ
jgi:predicted ATP-dependent protease